MTTISGLLDERFLTIDETHPAAEWARTVPGSPYGQGWLAFADRVLATGTELPGWVDDVAHTFQCSPRSSLLVHGLPTPDALVTPSTPFVRSRVPTGTEGLLVALALRIGRVISLADWHEGDRVQNLYPLKSEARRQNASNAVYLEFHTESAFRPDTPDSVLLLCLRGDERVTTLLCDLAAVWPSLSEDAREALQVPGYGFPVGNGVTTPLPIARFRGERWIFNYAEALVGVSGECAGALAELRAAIAASAVAVRLGTGDLLILDNSRVIHGRSPYTPRYDGTDRWLQRCLLGGGSERRVA